MRCCIFSLFLAVLRSLKATYEQALRRDDVRAIVVTGEWWYINMSLSCIEFDWDMKLISYVTGAGAKGKFSGGFDISSFKGKQMDMGMLCFFPVLYSDSSP